MFAGSRSKIVKSTGKEYLFMYTREFSGRVKLYSRYKLVGVKALQKFLAYLVDFKM